MAIVARTKNFKSARALSKALEQVDSQIGFSAIGSDWISKDGDPVFLGHPGATVASVGTTWITALIDQSLTKIQPCGPDHELIFWVL